MTALLGDVEEEEEEPAKPVKKKARPKKKPKKEEEEIDLDDMGNGEEAISQDEIDALFG